MNLVETNLTELTTEELLFFDGGGLTLKEGIILAGVGVAIIGAAVSIPAVAAVVGVSAAVGEGLVFGGITISGAAGIFM